MNDNNRKILKAKDCYGHLGGTLGSRLFDRLLELNWLEREEGKATVYRLTEAGEQEFTKMGIDIYDRR